jgi:hypothetical protein
LSLLCASISWTQVSSILILGFGEDVVAHKSRILVTQNLLWIGAHAWVYLVRIPLFCSVGLTMNDLWNTLFRWDSFWYTQESHCTFLDLGKVLRSFLQNLLMIDLLYSIPMALWCCFMFLHYSSHNSINKNFVAKKPLSSWLNCCLVHSLCLAR